MTSEFFKNKTIVITGGNGYLAYTIIKILIQYDCRIIRFDRPGTFYSVPSMKAKLVDQSGDIRNQDDITKIVAEADIIFHLAAQTSVYTANNNPVLDHEINVLPLLRILEECKNKRKHTSLVFSSTVTLYGLTSNLPVRETEPENPLTVYDLHKTICEKYLHYFAKEKYIKSASLRLANVYGPGPTSSSSDRGVLNKMIRKALNGEPLNVFGDGNYIRDYVYITDVAKAFITAAENIEKVNGGSFNIGTGIGVTLQDAFLKVADRVAVITGRRVPVVNVSLPESFSPIELRNFIADSSTFCESTGWASEVALQEGIDQTIQNFKQG